MRVNEIFKSIQGEGRFAGMPVLFVRLSGCTRNCEFCDTKYHRAGDEYFWGNVLSTILDSKCDIVVWTGGEPLLHRDEIWKVMEKCPVNIQHHLETNGDLLVKEDLKNFHYVCCSPKIVTTAKQVNRLHKEIGRFDIKVVTDMLMNDDMIQFATMLMPLTTNTKRDNKIRQDVWQACVELNKRYSPRLHYEVWGKKKGV